MKRALLSLGIVAAAFTVLMGLMLLVAVLPSLVTLAFGLGCWTLAAWGVSGDLLETRK